MLLLLLLPSLSLLLPFTFSVGFSVPPPVTCPVTHSVSLSVAPTVAYSVASSAPSSFSSSFAVLSLLATAVYLSVSVSCPFSSSNTWSLPSVVFSVCPPVWSSSLSSQSSHPLSSSVSSSGASVPTANVVSGVASSALVGGSDGSSPHGGISVAPVPEDSVGIFSHPLTFPDGDNPDLKSRSESQGAFK